MRGYRPIGRSSKLGVCNPLIEFARKDRKKTEMSVCIERADRFAGSIREALAKGKKTDKVNKGQEAHTKDRDVNLIKLDRAPGSVLKVSWSPFPKTLILVEGG